MKRHIVYGLTAILIALALFSAAHTPASAQDTRLLIWVRADWGFNPAVFESFEAETGIGLAIEPYPPGEMNARFVEAAETGTGPDIVLGANEWVADLAERGFIAPLEAGPWMNEFLPYAVQVFTVDEHVYGVPIAMDNLAFVRNAELVPDPPATWSDVTEISRQIRSTGAADYGFVLNEFDFYHFFPILSAFGGYMFGTLPDGTFDPADIGLNNPGAVAATSWLRDMVADDLMPATINWQETHDMFYQGRSAMIITGTWQIHAIRESGLPLVVSAFPVQNQPARPFVHVYGFMINANSPRQEAAHRFLTDHLANEPNMAMLHDSIQQLPTHVAVFEKMEDPLLVGFAEAARISQRRPRESLMGAVWDPMADAIQLVREGQRDPQDALDGAVEAIRANLEGR
jgi:maltose-binding protein MalE